MALPSSSNFLVHPYISGHLALKITCNVELRPKSLVFTSSQGLPEDWIHRADTYGDLPMLDSISHLRVQKPSSSSATLKFHAF